MNSPALGGILDVRLVPKLGEADVLDALHAELREGVRLRAAVAYASGYEGLGLALLAKRTGNDGYLCVDIRKPTNLEWLLALHQAGGRVRLNLRRAVDGNGDPKLPEGLLHSKMLLIDHSDAPAALWVGSHNWSRRALTGPNVESSLTVRLTADSDLYHEAQSTLDWTSSICEPFDPASMQIYRDLQRDDALNGEKGSLVRLYTDTTDRLSGEAVTVFGTDPSELRGMPSVESRVRVEVVELGRDETKTLYEARVLHTGLLGGFHGLAGGLSFEARRYAFRDGRRRPRLQPADEPPESLIERAAYFVTVEVLDEVQDLIVAPPEKPKLWEPTIVDPLLERMRPDRRIRGARTPIRVQVPATSISRRSDIDGSACVLPLPQSERALIERADEPLVFRVTFHRRAN